MDVGNTSTCQVCFVMPLRLFDYSQIVKCIKCQKTCHKSCYNPSLNGEKFMCDLCIADQKETEPCFICGNAGLLKKVEDQFAHPICLLFSPSVIVTQYKSLQFSIVKEEGKKDKKNKCSVCNKSGHLEKCFSKCTASAHMYCIWKEYHKAQVGDSSAGWNHNPVVNVLDYKFFFDRKAQQYLSLKNPNLLCYLKPLSKAKHHKLRQFELVCPNHTETMFECCMDKKYFRKNEDDLPVEYAQCAQCLKWYHQQCLDKQSFQKVQNQQQFVCLPCKNFHHLLAKIKKSIKSSFKQQSKPEQKQDEIYLKEIPRLNICELIYLQCLYEEKKYQLTSNEMELMFHLPIEPSLIFLEENLKKSILSSLKISTFESISHAKFELRMQKKQFKENFTKNIEKALAFLVGRTSLFQKAQEQQDQSQEQQKSEQILDQQEKKKLKIWIQLLMDFKEKYQEFDKVVTKLIDKMKRWLKTLTQESIKQWEDSEENQHITEDNQFSKIQEQRQSNKKQDPMSELFVKSLQFDEEPEQQQPMEQEIQKPNSKHKDKEDSEIQTDSNAINVLTEGQEPQKSRNIPYLDTKVEKQLLNIIKIVKKKADADQISIDRVYEILKKQNKNKTFTLDIILNPKISNYSTLKLIILEVLFQNFIKIQQSANLVLNNSQNDSQLIFNKELVKIGHHKSIKYLNLYVQKLRQIYDQCNIPAKKQFDFKIQYLVSAVTDLVTNYQNEIIKLDNKLSVQEALNQFKKNYSEKHHLIKTMKQQVGTSLDWEELAIVRIQAEKVQVYKKIKKVHFTNDSRIKMLHQYNDHCRSSSENIQKDSFQSEAKNKINLRKEIMAIQQQSLKIWLDMYGALFHLSNQLIALEKAARIKHDLQNGDIKQFTSVDKEPLEIIQEILKIDFSTKQQNYKRDVFLHCLAFFSKLQKAKINYKIFHETLIVVIQKLGQFCIMSSFENIQLWAAKQDNFKTVKSLYKKFRNLNFLNQNSQVNELFTKIWEVFEVDQNFEEYLEENQKLLFDDPEFTHELFIEKLPEMIKFYKQIGFINRVQQLKTISVWIACYFKTLKEVGFNRIFGDEFNDSQVRKKYQSGSKTTFNKINEVLAILQKAKVPNSSQFIKKVIIIYKQAEIIELEVQKYFSKSNQFIEKSNELKKQFLKSKNIEKQCYEYSEESHKSETTISSEQFEGLIEKLSNNSLSDMITWQLEKRAIQNQRSDFLELTQKMQNILLKSDTCIPIRDLNLLFFQVISYPFPYENLSVFYLYIRQRVERSNILSFQQRSVSKKRKEKVDSIQMIYRNLLDSLEPKEKMHFQNRLTREQIMTKFNFVEQLPESSQLILHPVLKEMRQRIMDRVEIFDGIKEDCQMIVQRINQNKLLTVKEILSLSESLCQYKQQTIFELGWELMYSQVEIYKLSFSPIPNTILDMQVLLEQLKSLKPSFKTLEILRKMKDIEVKITAQETK